MSEVPPKRVAIFGAGVAGMSAAQELIERGFEVTLYEQGNFELKRYTVGEDELERWREVDEGWEVGGMARSQLHALAGTKTKLPGEHGFRVFPSFYRHLTDTMKRIPTFKEDGFPPKSAEDQAAPGQERPPLSPDPYRRVAHNLVPVSLAGIAMSSRLKLYSFDQKVPRSMNALLRGLLLVLDGFGYRGIDLARFSLKMLQYATSSSKRRLGEYERMTLWDFLGGDRYEERFQRHLNSIPRALVAMDAYRADARTQLNILVQHYLDLGSSGEEVNRVLNGPTSDQWLRHWYCYLKEHKHYDVGGSEARLRRQPGAPGVDFRLGHVLVGFELGEREGRAAITGARVLKLDAQANTELRVEADYYLLAMPICSLGKVDRLGGDVNVSLAEVITEELARADAALCPDDPALSRLRSLLSRDPSDYTEWLSGAQIYLSEDLRLLAGHVFFPDSPWGLSVVSQGQFWSSYAREQYLSGKVRGVLSVDIANWDVEGLVVKKAAKFCTHQEIGQELWAQMQAGLLREPRALQLDRLSERPGAPYLDHHLDLLVTEQQGDSFFPRCSCWGDGDKTRADSPVLISPMMINPPGSWALRPGPLPPREQLHQGYRLRLGTLVLCGAYTQTYMGLHTMEGANESARHAVNAILEAENRATRGPVSSLLTRRYEPCEIFPLEDYEPADLHFWKKLDEDLYDLGDPHFMEILGLESLVDLLVPKDVESGHAASVEEIEARVAKIFEQAARLVVR